NLHSETISATVVLRVVENPEVDVLPAEDLVRRVCPLVPSAADPAYPRALLDIPVRAVVDIRVGVRFLIVLLDLLLGVLELGIHQFVPLTTGPHEKDTDKSI